MLKQVFTIRYIIALVVIFGMTYGFGWALRHSQDNPWKAIGGLIAFCVVLTIINVRRTLGR